MPLHSESAGASEWKRQLYPAVEKVQASPLGLAPGALRTTPDRTLTPLPEASFDQSDERGLAAAEAIES